MTLPCNGGNDSLFNKWCLKKEKKMKEKINGVWLSQMKKKNLTPTLHNTQKLIPNALQN